MKLDQLKVDLSRIEKEKGELLSRYNQDLSDIQDHERDIINRYLEERAKFKMGQKVIKDGYVYFIGWRGINRKNWDIEYRTVNIKKDGSAGCILSSYPYPESHFKSSQP